MTVPTNEELEAMLSDVPYIHDEGFSARVLHALPPQRGGVRTVTILGTTLVGFAAALFLSPVGPALSALVADMGEWHLAPNLAAATCGVGALIVAWLSLVREHDA